jgi:thymidylate kinase
MNNRVFYLTGPDGSGKTVFLKKIEDYYVQKNIETRHIWLRSPKILSRPLMAYCRIVGLTNYKFVDGVRYGKHEFYRSKFVSWLFPILQLIDFKFKWFVIKNKLTRNEVLLFDRFALDTLADLMVDTHRFNLHKRKIGRMFLEDIPKNTTVIVLNVNEDEIRNRKLDTLYDSLLPDKIEVYKILARDLKMMVVDNNSSLEITWCKILKNLT